MRILILNQTFHPDVAATGQLMWDVARHLRQRGHHVAVLSSRSFYGSTSRHKLADETLGGIAIHRVGGTALGKGSRLARMVDFASFYAAAAVKLTQLDRPDAIIALTSPPMIATLAMLLRQFDLRGMRRSKKIRVIYHVMDLYPDAMFAADLLEPSSRIGKTLSRISARHFDTADAIIALGRDMRERLSAVYHRHATLARIHVIPPWADCQDLQPGPKSQSRLAASVGVVDTFNIVYSGNLGVAHDLMTLIGAIDATRRDTSLRWIFIGGGSGNDALRAEAARTRWPHILFLPFQPREALGDSLNLADIHLVSQNPRFTGIVVPSKLAGIMAVGKPAIVIGPSDAECSRIVSENACGFVVPNGQPGLLLSRLETLRGDSELRARMGASARAAMLKYYDRPIACHRIEQILTNEAGAHS